VDGSSSETAMPITEDGIDLGPLEPVDPDIGGWQFWKPKKPEG
jgi:hypothetical protein